MHLSGSPESKAFQSRSVADTLMNIQLAQDVTDLGGLNEVHFEASRGIPEHFFELGPAALINLPVSKYFNYTHLEGYYVKSYDLLAF